MHVLKNYDQVGVWDPTDPSIRMREVYTGIPGGYGSFYWKTSPSDAQLKGLGTGGWTGLPSWAQLGIIAASAVGIGYFGWSKFGAPIKQKLGLSGARRRRR